ncbi:hypothetical protein ACFCV8_08070 [Streptomyces sp. NPDC056347]|uniref:hypothetical protein n=1 Tax=Streptomyces sp. NPDC056347 TaxID=3345790 RepID=UPI0035DA9B0E
MSTSQTFTATAAGAMWTDTASHIGTVTVTIDPTLKNAAVMVSTGDDEGPLAAEFRANTVDGDVRVSATPAAYGSIDVSTVAGDVTTRGTSQLRERVNTVSGKHRRH